MSMQNIFLLVAAGVNLIMSVLVFSRGVKNNKINLYFSLLTFFNFLWAISLFSSLVVASNFFAELSYRTAYFAAIGIAVYLFYFLFYFPHKIHDLKVANSFVIFITAILLALLTYSKWHIMYFSRNDTDLASWVVYYYKPFYLMYSIYFSVVVLLAIYFLVTKYRMLEGVMKNSVRMLLCTIIIGLIFGAYFNLILPFFNNWQYIWFGPIFTAFMNIYVLNLISPNGVEKI